VGVEERTVWLARSPGFEQLSTNRLAGRPIEFLPQFGQYGRMSSIPWILAAGFGCTRSA